MDATPKRTVRARFDGKVFVPEETIELPVGATVKVLLSSEGSSEDQRKQIFLSLIGSIDDPTFVEPDDLPDRDVPSL